MERQVTAASADCEKGRDRDELGEGFSCAVKVRKPLGSVATTAILCITVVACLFLVTSKTQLQSVGVTNGDASLVTGMTTEIRALREQVSEMQTRATEDRLQQARMLRKMASTAETPAAERTLLSSIATAPRASGVKKTKKTSVDTINFEETFNPTPEGETN